MLATRSGTRRSPSPRWTCWRALCRGVALGLVREWAKLRRDELMANWERARRKDPLLEIDPLP